MPAKSKFKLTLENYYSPERPHISNSMINDYIKSPAFFKKKYIDRVIPRRVTDPMKRGLVLDGMLTTPESFPYVRKFERTCTKKQNPEQYDKETQIVDEQSKLSPDIVVSPFYWDQALQTAQFIEKQQFWKRRLDRAYFQEPIEGELDGHLVCGLPDRVDRVDLKWFIQDLKFTQPIKTQTAKTWLRHCHEMGYLRQAALYRYLWSKHKDCPLEEIKFGFIAASYLEFGLSRVDLFEVDNSLYTEAMTEIRTALFGISRKLFADQSVSWMSKKILMKDAQ